MYNFFAGEVRAFAARALAGWLPCDGRALNNAEYPALFAAIGTTFGQVGDTQFRLPDLRGRVAIGVGAGPGMSHYTLGQAGGQETVTLTSVQMPRHQHVLQGTVHAAATTTDVVQPVNGRFTKVSDSAYSKPATTPVDHLAADSLTGGTSAAGGSHPHDNMQTSMVMNYFIATEAPVSAEDIPYLGQVVLSAAGTMPQGYFPCNGQLVLIENNKALNSLIGTIYGPGEPGRFALPDLRSRIPLCRRPERPEGYKYGVEAVALTPEQMPKHEHSFSGTIRTGDFAVSSSPAFGYPALGDEALYSTGPGTVEMAADSLSGTAAPAGGSQPHENRQPFLALQYLIAFQGVFPARG